MNNTVAMMEAEAYMFWQIAQDVRLRADAIGRLQIDELDVMARHTDWPALRERCHALIGSGQVQGVALS